MNSFKNLVVMLIIFVDVQANILLQAPKILSEQDIQNCVSDWETAFTWRFRYNIADFTCCYDDGQASFLVRLFKVPVRSYKFPYRKHVKEYIEAVRNSQTNYYYAQPLSEQHAQPKHINCEELHDIVRNKKIVFYTGAGISAGSDVATMEQLTQQVGLGNGVKEFIKKIYMDPQMVVDNFAVFCESAINKPPTQAHCALHEIAQKMEACILTDNVDVLHQKAGSRPVHSHASEVSLLRLQDWQEVDAVITIGFSHDDCGLLAHYKKSNPQGLIIAIDLAQPSYVSNEDYLVQGDAQTIIPALARLFKEA